MRHLLADGCAVPGEMRLLRLRSSCDRLRRAEAGLGNRNPHESSLWCCTSVAAPRVPSLLWSGTAVAAVAAVATPRIPTQLTVLRPMLPLLLHLLCDGLPVQLRAHQRKRGHRHGRDGRAPAGLWRHPAQPGRQQWVGPLLGHLRRVPPEAGVLRHRPGPGLAAAQHRQLQGHPRGHAPRRARRGADAQREPILGAAGAQGQLWDQA
mmetsp:Transcript_31407/g.79618  ORF Transcript_31407/g.79618 Transcript_31407/m.79618 type:complete len:207 (+) Transcript_31407:1160-1780(+)